MREIDILNEIEELERSMRIAEMEGGNRMRMEERLWELEERLRCLAATHEPSRQPSKTLTAGKA